MASGYRSDVKGCMTQPLTGAVSADQTPTEHPSGMPSISMEGGGHLSNLKAIIVTGTPGTGKTSFSKALSNRLGVSYVDLNEFLIEKKCYRGVDPKRGSYIVDLDLGRRMFTESFRGVECVVDSHISHLVVPKELVEVCFVLRTSPYVLMKRLKSIGFEEDKVRENCSAEILDVILIEAINKYGRNLICELNSTDESTEELVEEALKVLSGETEKKVGLVNWLKTVYERNDFKLFFK